MIELLIKQNLLAIADAFCAATGRTMTGISKEFYGKKDFFEKLRADETTVSIKKVDEIVAAFRGRWPDGTPWPETRTVTMNRNPARESR